MKKRILLLSLALFCACKELNLSNSEQGSDTASTEPDQRIPVRGTFGLVSLDSWNEQADGTRVATTQGFDPRAPENRAEFNLDSSGDGTISGLGQCVLNDPTAKKQPNSAIGNPGWDGLKGGVGLAYLVIQLAGLIDCARHPPGTLYKKTILLRTEHDLLGREVHSLSKNLGFVGGEKGDASAECKTMRGTRFVIVAEKASACIGFEDGKAEILRFILVKHGEIYANRIRMIRL